MEYLVPFCYFAIIGYVCWVICRNHANFQKSEQKRVSMKQIKHHFIRQQWLQNEIPYDQYKEMTKDQLEVKN